MLAGRRILLIEDQPLIVVSIRDILSGMSAELVGPGMTMEQAMYLAETETMDAAILDVWLKGEACYAVGDVLARRRIPFAVIGGGGSQEPDSFARVPRLLKPFTSDELARALYSLLSPH